MRGRDVEHSRSGKQGCENQTPDERHQIGPRDRSERLTRNRTSGLLPRRVGTGSGLDRFTGGAFGDGIEQNVRTLYRAILYNYSPGDDIFLFGFSRGAFTVRTLLGFVNLVGLVRKGDDYWVPELYGCYEKGLRPGAAEWDDIFSRLRSPHPAPPIRFVGVWDTVGALGAPGVLGQLLNGKKYAYHDISLNANIQNAYQALALDERRKPFRPSVWSPPAGWPGTLIQAWFVGSHCDVGGGQPSDGLANDALHWMVEKAEGHGLQVDSEFLSYFEPCYNGDYHDSMSAEYHLLGSIDREPGNAGGGVEKLHQSVLDRLKMTPPLKPGIQPKLKAFIAGDAGGSPPENTTRIKRDRPCPPRKSS